MSRPRLATQPTSITSLRVSWRCTCKLMFCTYALRRLRSSGTVTTLNAGFSGKISRGAGLSIVATGLRFGFKTVTLPPAGD